MRQVASPVTVVTTGRGASARGITIGSFTSTSMEPPLITFNLSKGARMHELLPFEDRFLVHLLRFDQVGVSDHFAKTDSRLTSQFEDVEHAIDVSGIPTLPNVLALFRCKLYNVFPAGDHSLIIGLVESVEIDGVADPLIYCDREYKKVRDVE